MIKAVIFDYFGVISSDEYWGFVKADKNMRSDFQNLAQAVNLGRLPWHDFMQTVAETTNRPLADVIKLYESERINPEVVDFARQLHKKYKTGLITNAHYEFIEPLIDKAHLHSVFDTIIISSRVGVTKPNPRIYEEALKKLKVKPQQAVMIDDIAVNVEGAKVTGMHGILYTDLPSLKNDLRELL